MSSRERLKRPTLERTGPVRNWTTLLGVPGFDATASDANNGKAGAKPDGGLNDVVSRSVELGYRVVDEYVRQGQATAQRFTGRSYSADAMTSNPQELVTRMTQYASDFAALWLEFMQLTGGGAGRWPMPPFDGAGARPASPTDAPAASAVPAPRATDTAPLLRVKVAVTSPYPTEVSLDVCAPVAARRIAVQALRAVSGDEPRLSDVALEDAGSGGPVTLRIRVPVGQPPGIYNGMIIDEETSVPVGTVSVRIVPE